MTREQAFEKVRKLLQTKGRTDAEADTAQILAACLAEKHGIDLAEVDKAENPDLMKITHKAVWEGGRVPDEATYASIICKCFFEVNQLERQTSFLGQLVLIGTDHHLTIAGYVFDFLVGEFRRAWNRRPNKRIKARKRFIYGCFIAIHQKLNERFGTKDEPANALVVNWKAKRDAYVAENFGEITSESSKPKNLNGKAANLGYRAGENIEIRDGVAAGQQPVGALGEGQKQLGWS
jgi:hypothetical protein